MSTLPIAVIGAGPVGLAAAAELAARGRDFVILEAGGTIASSIAEWGHVRLFSPWRFNTSPTARALLEPTGWIAPDPDKLPTGAELIADYLAPLATHPAIAANLRHGAKVTAIARDGIDKVRTTGRENTSFLLRLSDGSELLASAVIDASGTWRSPNPLGGNGLAALGETEAADRIHVGMPDVLGRLRGSFAGRSVAVVGAGHSATGTLLALAELAENEPGTSVHWLLRAPNPERAYGGGEADALPARGAIGTRIKALVEAGKVTVHSGFLVREVTAEGVVSADGRKVAADVIVNSTGARPDYTISTELRLDLDPILGSTRALAPLIDPNQHSCGTVPPHGADELGHPEPGFYAIGAKSYGRAPTFLLATGYEQARSVVAALVGDWEAARDVQLELPETGVCSSSAALGEDEGDSCCGTPAPAAELPVIKRGLATGVVGGLLTLPLVEEKTETGCCG
ncbi:NAD(P)-binding domain-containing protein [Phytomonospora endophytica]|uniref:Thioredoxin reductase n=1 Tax=Phytomonospora endophytica TaxID=714109 RepID=A0A841FCU2_9ACTN|nr:NAD(P)-binding domain-containing protein [Phytomonospora endophytica]MBB6033614.1 thioredoxin reductase [Phytomonospora endophytica]GIG64871.1 flavoprotein [Phytomonospora endophytica]